MKRVMYRTRLAAATASAGVPETVALAAQVVTSHSEGQRLTAPGVHLFPDSSQKQMWQLGKSGQPPDKVWVKFAMSIKGKRENVLLGDGMLHEVTAAANRIARRCHDARLAASPEWQELVKAATGGTFAAQLKEWFQQALAEAQAQAAGATAEERAVFG